MQASQLIPGDVFVECETAVWDTLSKRDRAQYKRATVEKFLGLCEARNSGRIHLRTSRGDWCIPEIAPVTLLEHVSTPAKGLGRAA